MNKIRECRQNKKLTLQQMSEELAKNNFKISADALGKYERGEREPKLETWIKLADFFGVTVSYLQGISGLKKASPINSLEEWFNQMDVSDNKLPNDKRTLDNLDNKLLDKELPAYFNEINIYEFNLLQKAMFNKTTQDSLKEYKDIASNLNDSGVLADITEFTRSCFEIALKAQSGEKKAIKCYEQINKIVSHYFGYDEYDELNS